MKTLRVLMGGVALAAAMAHAEPELSGTWQARYATDDGQRAAEATVRIEGLSGTWNARAGTDACATRSRAFSLSDSGTSTVTLRLEATPGAPACAARRARLTIVDVNVLEGEFDDGRVLRLERR